MRFAPLFLQFKVNTNDEEIKFSYRMYSSNDYPEDLKFREWICPNCNTEHDRDINASINIMFEGLKIYMKSYLI